jgi:hypothetical protein
MTVHVEFVGGDISGEVIKEEEDTLVCQAMNEKNVVSFRVESEKVYLLEKFGGEKSVQEHSLVSVERGCDEKKMVDFEEQNIDKFDIDKNDSREYKRTREDLLPQAA